MILTETIFFEGTPVGVVRQDTIARQIAFSPIKGQVGRNLAMKRGNLHEQMAGQKKRQNGNDECGYLTKTLQSLAMI